MRPLAERRKRERDTPEIKAGAYETSDSVDVARSVAADRNSPFICRRGRGTKQLH